MSGDISPMSPISPTPLVREKRHYPGEHKDKNLKKQKQADVNNNEQSEKESDDEFQQKPVNPDEKNVKVGHIDEYV